MESPGEPLSSQRWVCVQYRLPFWLHSELSGGWGGRSLECLCSVEQTNFKLIDLLLNRWDQLVSSVKWRKFRHEHLIWGSKLDREYYRTQFKLTFGANEIRTHTTTYTNRHGHLYLELDVCHILCTRNFGNAMHNFTQNYIYKLIVAYTTLGHFLTHWVNENSLTWTHSVFLVAVTKELK